MQHKLQATDSLRVALEMERRGHQLYVRAQSLTQDKALQSLLAKLAEDEASHFFDFQAMLTAWEPASASTETLAMAGAMAADFFYPGGLMQTAMEGALSSVPAMLEAAIASERDAIAFYQKLTENADFSQRPTILRILQEEHRHLLDLTAQYTACTP
ncbi:MAG: hypothetical protein RR482_04375 [Clostridia bacterium]